MSSFNEVALSFSNPEHSYRNQQLISAGMAVVMGLALVWRWLSLRPRLLDSWDPQLRPTFAGVAFQTYARRVTTGALVLVALLSACNYFYGTRNNGMYVHRWDAFHTTIGAKYFDELGYFELYRCSLVVDAEQAKRFRSVRELRNLYTRNYEKRTTHLEGNDCRARFSEPRWTEFKQDVGVFSEWMSTARWKELFKDKGFNGTPVYALVTRTLVRSGDVSRVAMLRLSLIDPLLMCVGFAAIAWAYGAPTAAFITIFFCVFFPNRYVHMGGSILRFDYVAALLIAFAALKKGRWGLAGMMFAWASVERVFPLVFAAAAGIKILADVVVTRRLLPEQKRFAGGFAGVAFGAVLLSLLCLEGAWDNWLAWAENMRLHNMLTAGFRVGFKHLFMFDGQLGQAHFPQMQRLFEQRHVFYLVGVACLLGPILVSVRRLDILTFSALCGVCAFFTLTVATRYYYGIVVLLFLVDRKIFENRYFLILGALLFAGNLFSFEYYALKSNDAVLYNGVVSLQLATAFALIASWLLTNPTLLDWGDDPRMPQHAPAQLGSSNRTK